jgi:hypothetical protein
VARKPNYQFERSERDRAKAAKAAAKAAAKRLGQDAATDEANDAPDLPKSREDDQAG